MPPPSRLQARSLSPVWGYGIAVLSIAAAAGIAEWPPFHLESAPVSLLLCAVMISAWFGGTRPGLFAAALSCLAFGYYFVIPGHSFALKPDEIPRVAIFVLSTLFVALVTAAQGKATQSLRNARDAMKETVQELQRTNDALLAESVERKDAEGKLRRSEGYLAEAQRLSHTGSWARDAVTDEIRYSSEEFYRVLGFDPSDGPPQYAAFLQRIHPNNLARVREIAEKARREKTGYELDYQIIRPGGDIRDVHVIAHAVLGPSGDLVEFIGTIIDVTERKRAEESLRRSEGYLAEAQRFSHTGSWAWIPATGEIRYMSEECYRVLGFDPHGGLPRYEMFFQSMHPDDRARARETVETARREKAEFDLAHRIIHPGGEIRDIHVVGHPVFNPSGDLVEFVGTVIDITERKRAEEEIERLRQAQADLAHASRVNTMGELTASLAHEVNQPIAAAVTNANACVRWLAGDPPNLEKAQAAAARIVKDGTRAAEIISRIRLLFKKSTAERELVNVNEVIREMIAVLHGETTRYNISVSMDLAADVPGVTGDRVQLQQVMMNLIMNSIDAMNDVDGTREIMIKSQPTENGQVQISISDTGVGLPPQTDQIFNAFFTTKTHGTGMGLRISRSIIESHDGRLWAVGNSPRGAIFNFTLPLKVETRE
jgi:PAS domain S-box-containing protein